MLYSCQIIGGFIILALYSIHSFIILKSLIIHLIIYLLFMKLQVILILLMSVFDSEDAMIKFIH